MKFLLPLIIGGGLLAGGYFIFGTDAGRDLMESIMNPSEKEERKKKWADPFKYLSPKTADAWDHESKAYGDIQKRIYKKYQSINDYYDY